MDCTITAAKVIRVDTEEQQPGLFFATSKDLKGLFIAKESLSEVYDAVPEYITDLYAEAGEDVIVQSLEGGVGPLAWVVIPVAGAEAALARRRLVVSH